MVEDVALGGGGDAGEDGETTEGVVVVVVGDVVGGARGDARGGRIGGGGEGDGFDVGGALGDGAGDGARAVERSSVVVRVASSTRAESSRNAARRAGRGSSGAGVPKNASPQSVTPVDAPDMSADSAVRCCVAISPVDATSFGL